MNQQNFINNFWMYYLTLESDFEKTLRYVELDHTNFSTYSIEYTKQYQSICAEIDVLCKEFCNLTSSNNVAKMPDYTDILLNAYPEIIDKKVKVKNKLTLMPWKDWQKNPDYRSPDWWSKYNKVKHNRMSTDRAGDVFFKQGNMGNVLNSLTGLFVLEMYMYKKISENENQPVKIPLPKSQIFELIGWESNVIVPDGSNTIFTIEEI